jgi:50S ribosome-binding GTPase
MTRGRRRQGRPNTSGAAGIERVPAAEVCDGPLSQRRRRQPTELSVRRIVATLGTVGTDDGPSTAFVKAVDRRTKEIVAALGRLDEDILAAPGSRAAWTERCLSCTPRAAAWRWPGVMAESSSLCLAGQGPTVVPAMPANLTPECKAAEAEYRQARTPEDRLAWLREMLRTIPKHKGTEHLRGDIKTRIKDLTRELAAPRRGGARTGRPTVVHREGAGQVALLGPPNSGKSALHARLTGSHAAVEPYPFTTQFPQPGMLRFQDVAFQLIDLPRSRRSTLCPGWPTHCSPPMGVSW